MRATVLAGTGRYGDPWHPFLSTSSRLADLLRHAGFEVTVAEDVDEGLAHLDGVDLLVVNAGDPWHGGETGRGAPEASLDSVDAAVDRGIGVLAVHNAIASLRDYPHWRRLTGGDWVTGVSGHPPLGPARIRVHPSGPLAGMAVGFDVNDERYVDLVVDDDITVLADHEHEDTVHPLIWTREQGRCRIAYDALGHDGRSYDSPVHREIIRRLVLWATRAEG